MRTKLISLTSITLLNHAILKHYFPKYHDNIADWTPEQCNQLPTYDNHQMMPLESNNAQGQAKLILLVACAKVEQRVTAQAANSINFRAAPVS